MPVRSLLFLLILVFGNKMNAQSPYREFDSSLMPHGNQFVSWETDAVPARTFYVDQNHPKASDDNPGSENRPWLTISRAAELLEPGDQVIIKQGVYREAVHPQRGGSGPDQMITYTAAPGEKVVISGALEIPQSGWQVGKGWRYTGPRHTYEDTEKPPLKVWQYDLPGEWFMGYNPFALRNLGQDLEWVDYKNINMHAHLQRRGRIFLDGHLLKQAEHPLDLGKSEEGAYWIEHDGLRIHVRFPGQTGPKDYASIEATVHQQVFTPKDYGLPYIHLKGLHFEKAGNGFAMPQRGMVSARRGNHWIIEDCILEWANGIAVDLGNEMWHTNSQPGLGDHIVRGNTFRHCGTGGLQSNGARQLLVEDNLFEHIGWHDAEHGWESGAIKFHRAEGTLIRRNIFRHITYAPGIWLDYLSSKNCRVTNNVFSDITTARGAIYVEVSRGAIHIDHNVFHNTNSQYWISGAYGAGGNALYTDGSDSISFHHNLAMDIENT
ncbi:MAG: right-handed parallel beta-helix repeat-containing protein, partial [Phaeodactylibacter sp.]|nr:right-handed parallel beta-helix repeat-containing protein [Phaeodactylibacter sp.]